MLGYKQPSSAKDDYPIEEKPLTRRDKFFAWIVVTAIIVAVGLRMFWY